MQKDVSIIFVNYKTKDLTINAIKSVYEKTQGIDFEIFVVDNASNDGSIEAIEQEFPDINIIKNPVNAGFGAANNLAIKQAKGKYILCLNTDTLLVNNAIKIMFDFMEKEENQNVGACGGNLIDKDGNPVICGGNLPCLAEILWRFGPKNIFKKQYGSFKSNEIKDKSSIGFIIGADIFARKSVLDKVGLFDENIFIFYEEIELCKRIRDVGYDIKFLQNARIIHLGGASTKDSLFKIKQDLKNEYYFFCKHHKNQALIYRFLMLLLYFIGYFFRRRQGCKEKFFYILRGYRD